MADLTWVLEPDVFPDGHAGLRKAATDAGHRVVTWDDDGWATGRWPRRADTPTVSHGSLGNAARILDELPWRPGSFCATRRFFCSAWYPDAAPWLLHEAWVSTTAAALVADPSAVLAPLGWPGRIFVRPDSPLRPFSGRVVETAGLSLRSLDHGFHYDDPALPVIAAPVRAVEREWRYVVCRGRVVAGSAYDPGARVAEPDSPAAEPWDFAAQIAADLPASEVVYVMDVCRSSQGLRLLELNPFSGAYL